MTPADKELLIKIRQSAKNLARDLKIASEMGYVINFSLDAPTGSLVKFEVKQQHDVDLDNRS